MKEGMPHQQSIGRLGESLAADFLIAKGYKILARNFYCGHQEIDIIALDPQRDECVIVEVKTLRGKTPPESGVTRSKLKGLVNTLPRLALTFSHTHYRCDVVAISLKTLNRPTFRHLENVSVDDIGR